MRICDWSSDVCSSDLQHLPDGAQAQRLSAFRTSRLGGWTPGESVEVRPFNAIGHELLQEERCRGGASESALGTIVEIGDIGFQHLGIRCPQRQTPDRIVDVAASFAQRVRQRSEEHTSELQSLMRISYAVFCLKKKKKD